MSRWDDIVEARKRSIPLERYLKEKEIAERAKAVREAEHYLVRGTRLNIKPDAAKLQRQSDPTIRHLSKACAVTGYTFEEKLVIAQAAYQNAIATFKRDSMLNFDSHLRREIIEKFKKTPAK
jgi:hypothetical protein